MDFNIADPAKTIVKTNSQENNQLLLNAIKNKFAAQTATEAAAFSPPKFDIPLLKIPASNQLDKSSAIKESDEQSKQLNEFLLKQLQEKHTKSGAAGGHKGFELPQFNTPNILKGQAKTESPIHKPDPQISSLTTAINKLQVQDSIKQAKTTTTFAIDLTTALASKPQTQFTPPTKDFIKPTINDTGEVNFEIPFIDCHRLDAFRKRAILLPTSNEYCITDLSQLMLQHSLVEPSAIGRFLCLNDNKYSAPSPLKILSLEYRQQQVKHHIPPFQFNTQSPDDIVLQALSKNQQRRHLN